MTKWGKVDYKQFEEFKKKLEKLQQADLQKFCEAAAKELAARLLRKVIKRTLPGEYPPNSGITGGTLRRGWTSKTYEEAKAGKGNGKDGAAYANSLPIRQTGNVYTIDIINPVEYAPYVEFGHRTRGHKGWVPGRFMLTESEIELDRAAPGILEKKLVKFLGEHLNGN